MSCGGIFIRVGLIEVRKKLKNGEMRPLASVLCLLSSFRGDLEEGVWLIWRGYINNL